MEAGDWPVGDGGRGPEEAGLIRTMATEETRRVSSQRQTDSRTEHMEPLRTDFLSAGTWRSVGRGGVGSRLRLVVL